MKIHWMTEDRLVRGAWIEGDTLRLPAAGGGVALPEIAAATERYLNLTLTVLEEHSMAFEFRAYAKGEAEPRVIVRFGLLPRYTTNLYIDMNWLDGHVLFPGHIPGELKVVCHGSRIARSEIAHAELVSMPVFHDIAVQLDAMELSDTPCRAALPEGQKLVDEMGQYMPKDWAGKMPDVATMVRAIRAQAELPDSYPFAWTKWGGDAAGKLAQGTGFFTKMKKDGRWYLLDPDGCAFFSQGPDCVVARADARVDGLEPLLTYDPGDDPVLVEPMDHDWGENDRGRGRLISYERANLMRAFGGGWYEAWKRMITAQLKGMGMNTLGNWTDSAMYGRMPYVTMLERFPETAHTIFRDFPDVLSPEYREDAARCAQALAQRRDDPFMIGYFLRNEPGWAFVDNLIIADEVLRDPEDTYCRRGLIEWLAARYGDIAALNAAWKTAFAGFDALRAPIAKASACAAQAEADLRAYSAELIRAYTSIPTAACRAVDPNHMILGMRWAWISDPVLASGWDCFDVFSINCYAVDPTKSIERVRELGVDLPVMIGEFHFGALDAGLVATGLEAVATQKERGKAYRYYCEHAAAHPMCVGCHYFQCYDQFVLGRFDGENYNIGLFDVCMQPYAEMAAAIRACAGGMYAIHAGEAQPTDEAPVMMPMIAY